MIRVYKIKTKNHLYFGVEVDKKADIIAKHRKYKFNPELADELNGGYELLILNEVKSLKTAENLEKLYNNKYNPFK